MCLRQTHGGKIATILMLLVGLLGMTAGCDGAPTGGAKLTATITATTTHVPGLPAFSDWRIAYSDGTSKVHAVSVDGTSDVTGGLSLLGLSRPGWGVPTPQVSPTGHLLAYLALDSFEPHSGLSMLDVSGHLPDYYNYEVFGHQLAWSLDGKLLAIGTDDGVRILRISDYDLTSVSLPSTWLVRQVLGWMNASHLVVIARPPTSIPTVQPGVTPTEVSSGPPPPGPRTFDLYMLDIASGALHPFVTFTSSTMGSPMFSLSPDGQTVLYTNSPFRDDPFMPDVALIDVKSGAMTHLVHIASTIGSGFAGVAFLSGTHTIAVSQGPLAGGAFRTWLLDTAYDTVTPTQTTAGAAVGWVPGTRTLILSTGTRYSEATGQGPFMISAVPDVLANPQAAATMLTTSAMTFPWLGFVKTA